MVAMGYWQCTEWGLLSPGPPGFPWPMKLYMQLRFFYYLTTCVSDTPVWTGRTVVTKREVRKILQTTNTHASQAIRTSSTQQLLRSSIYYESGTLHPKVTLSAGDLPSHPPANTRRKKVPQKRFSMTKETIHANEIFSSS